MSADLLRRAAAKLREHAEAATGGPWTVEHFDVDADGVLYEVVAGTDEDEVRPVPFATRTEDAGYHSQAEADVSYAALVHPPVALALADWIEAHADGLAYARDRLTACDSPGDTEHAIAVARAVLREPGDKP